MPLNRLYDKILKRACWGFPFVICEIDLELTKSLKNNTRYCTLIKALKH